MLGPCYKSFIHRPKGGFMKAVLVLVLMLLTMNVQARFTSPAQLSDLQQEQLIEVLNSLDPEILATIVTEETLDWYIEQFNRPAQNETKAQSLKAIHGRLELSNFNHPNAPTF